MSVRHCLPTWIALLLLAGACTTPAGEKKSDDKKPELPKGVTLEEQPKDGKAAKVVLVAGSAFYKPGEHDYVGGCAVLMDLFSFTVSLRSVGQSAREAGVCAVASGRGGPPRCA
jgi:hypothetical protein